MCKKGKRINPKPQTQHFLTMATSTNYDGHTEVLPREFRAKPIKKICTLIMSFIIASALMYITTVILAHLFVAKAVLFRPPTPATQSVSVGSPSHKQNATKKRRIPPTPKVEIQTIYVPPTQEDLDRIRQELEAADPLPPVATDDDEQRSAVHVHSVISSTESLLKQREEEIDKAKEEIEELSVAFNSFVARLEHDTSRIATSIYDVDLQIRLTSLRAILGGRKSFKDMDMHDVTTLFTLAMEELRWLSSEEGPSGDAQKTALFLNENNKLLEKLVDGTKTAGSEDNCQSSYLMLDEGTISNEFIHASMNAEESLVAVAVPPGVTEETARESDLYRLVESIKQALSRHENPDPPVIDEELLGEIRSTITPIVASIEEKRLAVLAEERLMRESWVGRMEALQAGSKPSDDVDDDGEGGGALCASTDVVTGMVTGGLEALRRRDDLRSALEVAALAVAVGESDKMISKLRAKIEKVQLPEIDYTVSTSPPSSNSSRKLGKKSISNAVDVPMLHRGVVGWIDFFVDAISGYNGEFPVGVAHGPSSLCQIFENLPLNTLFLPCSFSRQF